MDDQYLIYLAVSQKLTTFPAATVKTESSLETSIPLGIEGKSSRWISFFKFAN